MYWFVLCKTLTTDCCCSWWALHTLILACLPSSSMWNEYNANDSRPGCIAAEIDVIVKYMRSNLHNSSRTLIFPFKRRNLFLISVSPLEDFSEITYYSGWLQFSTFFPLRQHKPGRTWIVNMYTLPYTTYEYYLTKYLSTLNGWGLANIVTTSYPQSLVSWYLSLKVTHNMTHKFICDRYRTLLIFFLNMTFSLCQAALESHKLGVSCEN